MRRSCTRAPNAATAASTAIFWARGQCSTRPAPCCRACKPVAACSAACSPPCSLAGASISTTSPKIAYAAAFLAGFFMFLPMTALTTLPQELPGMTPARVTVVFGMFWAIAYIVETILMIVAGWIADKVGLFEAAVFVAVCSSSAFLVSFLLPETGKQKIEQPASV